VYCHIKKETGIYKTNEIVMRFVEKSSRFDTL